jgi:general secretion pathway protein D
VVTGDGYAKVVPEAEAKLQSSPTQVGVGSKGSPATRSPPRSSPQLRIGGQPDRRAAPADFAEQFDHGQPGQQQPGDHRLRRQPARLSKIIAALDAPVAADLDVIPVRYAIASDLAAMVNKLLEPAPGGDSGRVTVVADPRTNSVVVRAPSPARANLAKSLIAKLDQPTSEAGNVHVVYLKNADATKLAQTLRAVVSKTLRLPQHQQGTSGGSVQTTGGAPGRPAPASSNSKAHGGRATAGQQQNLGGGGRRRQGAGFIQADASTNTLIITAPDAVYRNLRAVIDMLDVRRAQVYIESLIVEVNANKAAEFGVQWLGLTGNSDSKYRVGGVQASASTAGSNIGNLAARRLPGRAAESWRPACRSACSSQINGELGLGAVAHALENEGNANILSTPNMLTLDNELATIKVGQNVPIISGSVHHRRHRRRQPVPDHRPRTSA